MKAYIIQTGHFSKAGNFIGFSALGERVHIYKKQIFEEFPMVEIVHKCLGIYENAQIKFPFYCLADVLTFNNTDGTTFDRRTAIAISKDKIELKYYSLERSYAELVTENNSLKQSLCDLESKCAQLNNEKLDLINDYNELLLQRDPERDTEEIDRLKVENDDIREQCHQMLDNYKYAQSERERLQQENDDLKHQIEIGGWDDCLNKEEVERLNNRIERLEKKCQDHENTIMDLQAEDMTSKHVISRIQKLTQDYFNKLIV